MLTNQVLEKNQFNIFLRDISDKANVNLKNMIEDSMKEI
jgi:hypothetical protein